MATVTAAVSALPPLSLSHHIPPPNTKTHPKTTPTARSPRLKLHILDSLRDLTTHWSVPSAYPSLSVHMYICMSLRAPNKRRKVPNVPGGRRPLSTQTNRYGALREAAPHGAWGAALIDTRQQSAVVRELSKLANASNAGNVEVRWSGGGDGRDTVASSSSTVGRSFRTLIPTPTHAHGHR